MHRHGGRDLDRRRLELLAAVFFIVALVDVAVAVQMTSWWMTAASVSCAAFGSLLLRIRQRMTGRPIERSHDDQRCRI